jgi:hypothetical protein
MGERLLLDRHRVTTTCTRVSYEFRPHHTPVGASWLVADVLA